MDITRGSAVITPPRGTLRPNSCSACVSLSPRWSLCSGKCIVLPFTLDPMGGSNSKFRASPGAGNQPGALQGARAERTVTPTGIESEKARFPTASQCASQCDAQCASQCALRPRTALPPGALASDSARRAGRSAAPPRAHLRAQAKGGARAKGGPTLPSLHETEIMQPAVITTVLY